MNSSSPTTLLLWVGALLLSLASLVFGYLQLDGLPDLGVQFGPDLSVRSVSIDRDSGAEHQEFKRGDRIVAVQNQSVEDLRDLRTVLQSLPEHIDVEREDPAVAAANGGADEPQADEPTQRTISYQLVRPLHRFPIALQGELKDPTALPPGVEPSDRLVELDGRALQTKVGPEAVRSIVSSRPEALLVFERKNAVFSGKMAIPPSGAPYGVMGALGMATLFLLGLWAFRSRELEPGAIVAVSFETIAFAWIALLAVQYQWMLSDYGLIAAVVAGFALVRPFAFFARNIGEGYGTQSGWFALLLGGLAAGVLIALLFGGYFHNAEQAVHVAALLAGLFVVYEVFLASVEGEGPGSTLGEGSGYLAWILVLALFLALVAWYLAPISFEENRWRWFAAVIVGLVWFGDVLHCFHGPATSDYSVLSKPDGRRELIVEYLGMAREMVPETDLFFVVGTYDDSVVLSQRAGLLEAGRTSEKLHDAVSILIQEGVRVPLPDVINRQAHPMGGIASAMDMALAIRLSPPDDGVRIDDVDLVLVGIERRPVGELPAHPSIETLDELRHMLSSETWTAAIIEGLTALHNERSLPSPQLSPQPSQAEDAQAPVAGADGEVAPRTATLERADEPDEEPAEEPEQTEQTEQTEQAEEPEQLEVELDAPKTEAETSAAEELDAPPPNFEGLLEPELLDAVEYLLDSGEPIVLGGAAGAGKTFIARCAHQLEDRGDAELALFDAAAHPADLHLALLFGEGPNAGDETALIDAHNDGALLIRSAQALSDAVLLRLCQAAELDDIRLYLAFDDPEAEARTVLSQYTQELQELLEHRELIVPRLTHRPQILQAILEHLAAEEGGASLSAEAIDTLGGYDFPGEIPEAREIIAAAAASADGETIEPDDLPEW